MGSPARRLINPITRCWAHPHYGYAGTDDRQGTDLRLDTKRLTLMSGRSIARTESAGEVVQYPRHVTGAQIGRSEQDSSERPCLRQKSRPEA
jgi:hypothetical protein